MPMSDGNGHQQAANGGGSGGKTDRNETGRTELQDQRLTMLAVRRNWIKGTRWATDATVDDLQEATRQRKLTVKERAIVTVLKGFDSADERIQQIAAKTTVSMESQNQADELALLKSESDRTPGVTVNVGISLDERRSRIAEICRTALERNGTRGDRQTADGNGRSRSNGNGHHLPAPSDGAAGDFPRDDTP
jgi:hypothetical protein